MPFSDLTSQPSLCGRWWMVTVQRGSEDAQPQMGHLHHPLLKAAETLLRKEKDSKDQRLGRMEMKTLCPLGSRTHSSCGYEHKVKSVLIPAYRRRVHRSAPLIRVAMASRWLLGEKELYFFKDVALHWPTMLQWTCPHQKYIDYMK